MTSNRIKDAGKFKVKWVEEISEIHEKFNIPDGFCESSEFTKLGDARTQLRDLRASELVNRSKHLMSKDELRAFNFLDKNFKLRNIDPQIHVSPLETVQTVEFDFYSKDIYSIKLLITIRNDRK